jgi:AcrR family transcriptional regulator
MKAPKPPVARKRNAPATREAILQAARKAFATSGYDGAGVRQIAEAAGVTAMMVNHYFGSKEQLFTEVLIDRMKNAEIIRQEVVNSPDLARALAEALVAQTQTGAEPLDGFLILLKSVSDATATEIGREQIERFHQRRLAEAIGGPRATQRAALVLAVIAGFQLMRQMIGLRGLAGAKPDELADVLASLFGQLLAPKTS